MYHYKAKLVRVVDGDTVVLDIDLGMGVEVQETCRLFGINAPEPHTETRKAGDAATEALEDMLENNWDGTVKTFKDKYGKYGRYLVDLPFIGGSTINTMMIRDGHAISYMEDE